MFYFGDFSFDLATGELTRNSGGIERLTPQVAQVLRLMVEQPGEVIGREEFRRQLWPDTTVEFDQGLSFCIRQLRIALGDDASNPRYIETLPRRGYRFRCPVARERSAPASDSKKRRVHRAWLPAAIAAVLIVVGGLVAWRSHRASASAPVLAIVPFDIDSSMKGLRSYRDALADVLVERATTRAAPTVVIIGPGLTRDFGSRTPIDTIRARLGASFALSGVVRRAPNGFDLFAQLVRSSDRGHIWAFRVTDSTSAGDYASVGARIADSVARILLDERGERSPLGIERPQPVVDRVVHDLCNVRVALLGESRTHGFGKTMAFKAELTRRLIDECHYNAFLIETGTYDFVNVRKALKAGRPLTQATVGAAFGLWANGDVEPLIQFLTAKAQQGSVVLGGLDDQLNRGTYAQLQMPADLVEYLPANDRERCRAILQRHMLWQYTADRPYGPPDKARILACLDDVANHLPRERDANIRDDDSVMVASLRRLFARDFDDTTVDGASADTRSFNNRDRSMYENFRWWMSHLPPQSKVIVWTATVHAAKISVPGQEHIVPMGSYIARDFSNQSFVLGISALSGTYGMMRQPARTLTAAPDSSLEARALASSGADSGYLGRAELRAAGSASSRVLGVDFATTSWADVIDGLLVFRDERPPKPLGSPIK